MPAEPVAATEQRPSASGWTLRLLVGAARITGVLAWAAATWTLPDGDQLFLVALVVPLYCRIIAGALRPDDTLPLPGLAENAGIWWGLAIFTALLPNLDRLAKYSAALPKPDWPYRPDVLYPLLALGLAIGFGLSSWRLRRAGWALGRAVTVAAVSLAFACGTAWAVLFFAHRL